MAGQDYTKRLSAGGIQPVNIAGDYIFCKAADRPFSVIMDGSRTTMAAGDKYRPGAFKEFEIENTDPENPIFIVLTIGQGDYNRQIVQGEIMVEPGLRRADGTFAADTRYSLEIDLTPSNLAVTAYTEGQVINQVLPPASAQIWNINQGPDGTIAAVRRNIGDGFAVDYYDQSTLALLATWQSEFTFITPDDICFWPGVGLMMLDQGRLYTLDPDGSITQVTSFPGSGVTLVKTIAYDFVTGNLVGYRSDPSNEVGGLYSLTKDFVSTFTKISKGNNFFRIDAATGQYVFMLFYDMYFVDRNTLNQIEAVNHPTNYYENGGFVSGKYSYGRGFNAERDLNRIATRAFTTKPEFIAVRPGCGLKTALIKPGAVPQVSADITAISYLNGIELSGELIKAALEFYFRRKVEAGYLDHIYSVDFGRDGNGNTFKPIHTGNQTFDRANVVDDFITLLPGQITMTIDNELSLGGPL